MPESGKERHPAPVHLVLTNDSPHRRTISLSKRKVPEQTAQAALGNDEDMESGIDAEKYALSEISKIPHMRGSAMSSLTGTTNVHSDTPSPAEDDQEPVPSKEVPRLALAIRLRDNFEVDQLSIDLFLEWLRNIPTIADQVKVEAGFHSFSFLLIVSIPIALSGYIPSDPAVVSLGPITSSNLLQGPWRSPPIAEFSAHEAASKRRIIKPFLRRQFGDGSELDGFDKLPPSRGSEQSFIKVYQRTPPEPRASAHV